MFHVYELIRASVFCPRYTCIIIAFVIKEGGNGMPLTVGTP